MTRPADRLVGFERGFDAVPDQHPLRFFAREDDVAAVVFEALDEDVEFVAGLDRDLAVIAGDLMDGQNAFGFVADVDDDFGAEDLQDTPADDVALGKVRHFPVVHVEQLVHAEAFEVVVSPPFRSGCFRFFGSSLDGMKRATSWNFRRIRPKAHVA